MRIMVFDVPAESGGALSVLHEFYNEYKKDINNEYIFVVSKPQMKETSNIKVLRYPAIKKSWIHRMFFDYLIAPKLVKIYKADKVISLQNVMIPNVKVQQSIFVHNALPFTDYRFSIFEDKILWIYQNVLSKIIFKSILKADKVLVQTSWMRDTCVRRLNVSSEKVEIIKPRFNIEVEGIFRKTKESMSTFFYPASAAVFKNHQVIVEACAKLKEEGVNDYKVIFTLLGNENKHISKLFKRVHEDQLPIEFINIINKETVFDYYTKSILLFPSFIETVGLPLIEAMHHKTPILSSNCEYSYEILSNYDKAVFFDYSNHDELAEAMKEKMKSVKDVLNDD